MNAVTNYETLASYRREVSEMYARVRNSDVNQKERWSEFCRHRDNLFATHPQSALSKEQRTVFKGLRYYPYNPSLRYCLTVDANIEPEVFELDLQDDGLIKLQSIGKISFEVAGQPVSLTLFWIFGYGGGLFLPFRDLTNETDTFGGGRYLLDTIKGADLGQEDGRLIVDFNYAYNPSCAYNPRWYCPLTPPENWLTIPIRAGELRYAGE